MFDNKSYLPYQEVITKGADSQLGTFYLDKAVSAGSDARNRGAILATNDYTASIPTSSYNAKSGNWTVYEANEPIFATFISELDATIVHVPDNDNYNTHAEIVSFVTGAATGGGVSYYPTVVAGIASARVVNSDFNNVSPNIVKRFAVRSNTTGAGRLAVRCNSDIVITKIV